MRSRFGRRRFGFSIRRVQSLKLTVLVGGMLLTTSCLDMPDAEHPGAVYDAANRGDNGQFKINGKNGSGQAVLPAAMKYNNKVYGDRSEPIREWTYRYRWLGTDGKQHYSEWKSLGVNPDGSAVCNLTIRPSEVPEILQAWDAGRLPYCTCEAYARFKTLDGKGERFQSIPIPVEANLAAGSP